jgi:hypothetical protein
MLKINFAENFRKRRLKGSYLAFLPFCYMRTQQKGTNLEAEASIYQTHIVLVL